MVDQIFMKWAQVNNGRWLPYSVRKVRANSFSKDRLPLIESWASILKTVNVAKAYYRNLISVKIGKKYRELDQYLDSLYVRNYNSINSSMKYSKTMDSLFHSYRQLSVQEMAGSIYIAGAETKKLKKIVKALTKWDVVAKVEMDLV